MSALRSLLFMLLVLPIPQDRQATGAIEGIINLAGTNFPIAGVRVKAATLPETITDDAGRFAFQEVPPQLEGQPLDSVMSWSNPLPNCPDTVAKPRRHDLYRHKPFAPETSPAGSNAVIFTGPVQPAQ